MSFVKETLMTFGTRITVFLSGIIASILTARILGPEGKGIVAIVFLIPKLVASFGSLGLGSSAVYFLGKKKYQLAEVFSNSMYLAVVLSALYFALFFLFFDVLSERFYRDIPRVFALVAFVSLPINLLLAYGQGILRGLYKIGQLNVSLLLQCVSYVALLVVLLVLMDEGVVGAIVAYLISYGLMAIYVLAYIASRSGLRAKIDTGLLTNSLRFGLKEHVGTVAQRLNLRIDMFFITAHWGPEYVGFYAISVALAELVWYVPDSIGIVMFPKISSLDKPTADRFAPIVCRTGLFVALVCSLALASVSAFAVRLMYGEAFLPSVKPLLLLLPGVLFLTVGKILTKYTSGIGKPQYNTYASLASFVTTIALLAVLVPRYHMIGAAVATSIAYLVFAATILVLFVRESGNGVAQTLVIRRDDFGRFKDAVARLKASRA
jgi:O-antigen/teichoic acid export membrane protein